MPQGIDRVTVIGAGTMGASIAGLLANAGVPVHLLDVAPDALTADEEAKGLSLDDARVRNRLVQQGFQRMAKAKPANLFTKDAAELITLGNLDDDLESAASESDWIIEVIVERPGPKQALMERLEQVAPKNAIISTNTSGIPVHIISQGRGDEFKQRFLGTHFFNPPRYLHLLEIIPTPDTDEKIVQRMKRFAESVLGKGVVICKDTPNFIANRMISFIQSDIMDFAIENGYSVEEVDKLTGTLLGRPKTGTFRLNDVIGIDVMALVSENLYGLIPDDEDREILQGKNVVAVMNNLVENKFLGSKSGQGFYQTVQDERGKKSFHGLDLEAASQGQVSYVAPQNPRWSSVGDARNLPLAERLQALVEADDEAGELIWHTLAHTMSYATKRLPEIADSIVDIDNAMKWGFAWQMGPFETWDALGVEETLSRMEAEGIEPASWVQEMLDAGHNSFYTHKGGQRLVYSPLDQTYCPTDESPLNIRVADVKRVNQTIEENDSASLVEMGDGVMLLEFHSKMNALDDDIFHLMNVAAERLHGNARGLVIANDGENFCVGANLFQMGVLAQSGAHKEMEHAIRQGQNTLMNLRRAPGPVVAAPFQRVLGGGVEVCVASDAVVAHAETYMGLVELGVGLIPGWGGTKETVRRLVSPHMHATNVNPTPYLRKAFENIGYAKVSMSAAEAREMGYLDEGDRIVMNRDHLLAEAKREALRLADDGYTPPVTEGNVYASGKDMLASMQVEVYSLQQAGYISEYDAELAGKLAYILTGGNLSAPAWMDEQYFLDLEAEAILTLLGQQKTQERVWHMLQNGKPLRN